MTSPATVLDVNGDVTARADAGGQAFRAFGRTGDDFAWAPLTFTNTGAAYNGGIAWTPSGATIAVGSGLANVMSWLPSGYVGIGTTNPAVKLHVNGTSYFGGTTSSDSAVAIYSGGNTYASIEASDPTNFATKRNLALSAWGGNVGIGTTSPTQKLQVGTSGDGSVALANAWNTFSDARLKNVVGRIPNACGIVDQLNGYYYTWKSGADQSRQVGVIAQEVEAVLPELVKTGSDGIKTVDYPKLTAVLIEANKEQSSKIAQQNDRLAEQASRISDLEQTNQQLKAWACSKDNSAPFCK